MTVAAKQKFLWGGLGAILLAAAVVVAVVVLQSEDGPATEEAESDEPLVVEEVDEDGWRSVSVGEAHGCAIQGGGALWCWGVNSHGQVGDGTEEFRSEPVQITEHSDWVAVAAGETHTCGVRADGSAWCWGENSFGQLGDGTTESKGEPARVEGEVSFDHVTVGAGHSCGLGDGVAHCWGDNRRGQLGDGSRTERAEPTAVATSARWRSLEAASYYTCGVRESGAMYCWGGSEREHPLMPTAAPTRLGTEEDWVAVVAGDFHTCGIQESGSMRCWGNSSASRLGMPTGSAAPESLAPVAFAEAVEVDETITAASAGTWRTCGITDGGQLTCQGQPLGIEAPADEEMGSWEEISVGRRFGCGIREGGGLHCWAGREVGDGLPGSWELPGAPEVQEREAVEFFTAAGSAIEHHRVGEEGLEQLRVVELPGDVEDMEWVPGQGLAILVIVEEDDEDDGERFCGRGAVGCEERRMFLWSAGQWELEAVSLPRDIFWPRVGEPEFPGIRQEDNGRLVVTDEGEVQVFRCHHSWEKVGCTGWSAMQISPQRAVLNLNRPLRRSPRLGRSPGSWETYSTPGVVLEFGAGEVLCMRTDGESFHFGADPDAYEYFEGGGWVSFDPPIFEYAVSYDAGNTDNPDHLAPRGILHRACSGAIPGAPQYEGPIFGPEGVFVTGGELYFGGVAKGELGAARIRFRPVEEEPGQLLNREGELEGVEEVGEFFSEESDEFASLPRLREAALGAWIHLPASQPACEERYTLQDGVTVARLYCHLRSFGTLATLEVLVGKPVFLRGPHYGGNLDMRNQRSFGHYNPEFVRGITRWAIPALEASAFQEVTQGTYDRYIGPLAQTYDVVRRALVADEENYAALEAGYRQAMEEGRGYRDDRIPRPEVASLNNRSNAARFWLRRRIDGTEALFAEALQALREVYE